ncbi:hypothetical protein ACFE04_001287 [Oxalis oulophora]
MVSTSNSEAEFVVEKQNDVGSSDDEPLDEELVDDYDATNGLESSDGDDDEELQRARNQLKHQKITNKRSNGTEGLANALREIHGSGTSGEYVISEGRTEIGWGSSQRPTNTSEWAALHRATPKKKTNADPTKTNVASKQNNTASNYAAADKSQSSKRNTQSAKTKNVGGKSLASPPLPKGHVGFKRSGALCIPGRAEWATLSQIKEQAKGKGKGKIETKTKRSEWRNTDVNDDLGRLM